MSDPISRRDALKHLAASSAGVMFAGVIRGEAADIVVAGQPVEIVVSSVSAATVRITVRPLQSDNPLPVPVTGALAQEEFGNALSIDAARPTTCETGKAPRARASDHSLWRRTALAHPCSG